MRAKLLKIASLILLVLSGVGFCQGGEEPYEDVYYFRRELLPWEEERIKEAAPKVLRQILLEDREGDRVYQWLEGATIGRAVPEANDVWGVRMLSRSESLKGTKWENLHFAFGAPNEYLVELIKGRKRVAALRLNLNGDGETGWVDEEVKIWEEEAKEVALPYARERGASIGEVWLDRLPFKVGYGPFYPPEFEELIQKEEVVYEELGYKWVVGLIKDDHLVGVVRVDARDGKSLVIDFPVPCRLGSRLTTEQLIRAATVYAMTWGEKYWRERPDFTLELVRYNPPEVQNFFPVEPQPDQFLFPKGVVFFESNISIWDPGSPWGSALTVTVSMFGELRWIRVFDPDIFIPIGPLHILDSGSSRKREGIREGSKEESYGEKEEGEFRGTLYLLPLFLLPAVFGFVLWRKGKLLFRKRGS